MQENAQTKHVDPKCEGEKVRGAVPRGSRYLGFSRVSTERNKYRSRKRQAEDEETEDPAFHPQSRQKREWEKDKDHSGDGGDLEGDLGANQA